MWKTKDGIENELAFPSYDHLEQLLTDGMTLRDYFAAKAMQGLISVEGAGSVERYAEIAYIFADTMLIERQK